MCASPFHNCGPAHLFSHPYHFSGDVATGGPPQAHSGGMGPDGERVRKQVAPQASGTTGSYSKQHGIMTMGKRHASLAHLVWLMAEFFNPFVEVVLILLTLEINLYVRIVSANA